MALNPSLLRLITPPDTVFDLHVPAGTAALYQQLIAAIPESKRNSWRYHRVVADDTLASVAHEYRVTETELAAANQLRASDSIAGVEALVVPAAPAAAPSAHTVLYTARKGDTLVTIADRFGVSLAQLRRWNQLAGNKVEPGRRLRVAEPTRVLRASGGRRRRSPAHRGASAKSAHAAGATGAASKPRSASSAKTRTTKKPAR